jgi:hypothetical protein
MDEMTLERKREALNEIVKGRTAECSIMSCSRQIPSDAVLLPFFEYRENQDTDLYYCGCIGWD